MSRPPELERLIKVLGLLGSTHAGERAAAGLKATELLRSVNLTWADIINPKPIPTALMRTFAPTPSTISADLGFLHANLDLLTDSERKFVFSLGRFRRLSPKQCAVVDQIVSKVQRRAA
jgi:hypothetical protein